MFHPINSDKMNKKNPPTSYQVLPITRWSAKHLWEIKITSLLPLLTALSCLGIGEAFLLQSHLGSAPWTILSQGISVQTGISIGTASFIISAIVMLAWIPLHLQVGLGTLLNIVVIAVAIDITLHFISTPDNTYLQLLYAGFGILLIGISTAFYLTCYMGSGPRDGLMVGLCQRYHINVGITRTLLETSVAFIGFILGGTLGLTTVAFAISIGWIIQLTLKIIQYFHSKKKL